MANPGLFFALVAKAARLERCGGEGLDFLLRIVNAKDKSLAAELEFPPGSCGVLRKVCPEGLTGARLERLKRELWKPAKLRLARHLSRLGVSALVLLVHPVSDYIKPRFFHEIAEQESSTARNPQIAKRLLRLFSDHGRFLPGHHLQVVDYSHFESLWDRHCHLMEVKGRLKVFAHVRFPPPPIPGNDWITPLATPEALMVHGACEGLCCGDQEFLRSVQQGERFFYRTHGGGYHALTVELVRDEYESKTIYRLGEVRAAWNGRPAQLRQKLQHLAVWAGDFFRVPDDRILPCYHPASYDYSPPYDKCLDLEHGRNEWQPCLPIFDPS